MLGFSMILGSALFRMNGVHSFAIAKLSNALLKRSCRVCSVRNAHEGVVKLHSDIHGQQSTQKDPRVDPLVLIHGVFGNRRNFSAIAKRVAQMNQIEVGHI